MAGKKRKIIIVGIIAVIVVGVFIFTIRGAGENPNTSQAVLTEGADDTKVLVAYFSRANAVGTSDHTDVVSSASLNLKDGVIVGNTEMIAERIADISGADLFPIITEKAYFENYSATLLQAGVEMMLRSRPSLAGNIENPEQYEVIFLGFPNWDGTLPMAVASFLKENDLSGKIIVPFVTHKGSGFGSSMGMIEDLAEGATVYADGWSWAGDSAYLEETQQDAAAWAENILDELGLAN